MYFRYFLIVSPWKRMWSFIWTNLNSHHPRMLCAKFGWYWPSGSWEEDENVKSLQTDGRTTDNRRSEKLTWAFSSGELKQQEAHGPLCSHEKQFVAVHKLGQSMITSIPVYWIKDAKLIFISTEKKMIIYF